MLQVEQHEVKVVPPVGIAQGVGKLLELFEIGTQMKRSLVVVARTV
jgi:hypothetical protein